jgi:hypothetical protein
MSASVTPSVADCAPGNTLALACSGLINGAATLTFVQQGAAKATTTVVAASVASNVLSFAVPDGLSTDTATVADSAMPPNTASLTLRVHSQYVQASEYIGEGVDTSGLATGELDVILRRASGLADAFMGGSRRQLQYLERHKYRRSRRVFPYHKPIVSCDALVFVSAQQIRSTFNVTTDIYTNPDLGYIEILAYALGQYALLGALEVIGFSANVIELTVTCGYPWIFYPERLREAVTMIATELLTFRDLQNVGMGAFEKFEDELTRRKVPFSIPEPAKYLLRPYATRSIR